MSKGIDYGMGRTNRDKVTGIRFGVISANEVCQAWADSSEVDYGKPHCPKCGNKVADSADVKENYEQFGHNCANYACDSCKLFLDSSDVLSDEPLAWTYDAEGYRASQSGDDCDIFIVQSPFYTRAAFCSPCAPGACYLMSPEVDGERAYCFGHDWFDGGRAPYPVYRVSDDTEVLP